MGKNKAKKKMVHKWIITDAVCYEVDASSSDEALEKFKKEGPGAFSRTHQWCDSEDWWDGTKKDKLQKIIIDALEAKFAKPANPYDEKHEYEQWKKYKKVLNSAGWETDEIRDKYLYDEEGGFDEHPEAFSEDYVGVCIIHSIDNVYFVNIPKDEATKVLTMGSCPF